MPSVPAIDREDGPSDAAAIKAHVVARGGQIVASGARVALAILEGRPVLLLMEGSRADTQAELLQTGIGRARDIRDPSVSGMARTGFLEAPNKPDIGKVYDLPEGEARLGEVMEIILADISPRVFALMSGDAGGEQPADPTGSEMLAAGPRVWRDKAECLDALAPLLEIGWDAQIGPGWAAVIDFLTKDLSDELRDRMKTGERAAVAHLVLATPGLGKTRSVQALIEALPPQAVIWVFQPTLRKAHEFAQDMAGSTRPVRVFRGRGASVAEGATETMCNRHAMAAAVAAKGLSVQPAPDWLIQMTPERMARDPFPLHDLLSQSLYYPSSSFDGDPIAYLGGNNHSFVYADYGEERDGLLKALKEPGFLGYRILCHRPVLEAELTPMGWSPVFPNGRA
jgi:hypothetical protein